MEMLLNLFAGSLTVTVKKDSGITSASASPSSSLAKNDTVTLTITPASGYSMKEVEVIEGGVTVAADNTFKMGESDVVLFVKSKTANNYMVTEETMVSINDAKTVLHKNTIVQLSPNGVPIGVTAASGGTVIAMNDAVQSLIDQGILIPI